jgi:adenosylhomocysteine nucleosidase
MSGTTLVCFAVPQEAKPFLNWARGRKNIEVVVTGMGARNAERAIGAALEKFSPAEVFTCGFAGALNPELSVGDVVFDLSTTSPKTMRRLIVFGIIPVTFHCSKTVAVSATAKAQLLQETGADVVEMESQIIQKACAARKVPCVTLRAISDTAAEDLPLDFNTLLDDEEQLSPSKLTFAILRAPHKIPSLMRLGRNSARAARELCGALVALLEP